MKNRSLNTVFVLALIALLLAGGCSTKTGSSTSALVTLKSLFGTVFYKPVALVQHPGDGTRWYILEKAGLVLIMDTDSPDADPAIII